MQAPQPEASPHERATARDTAPRGPGSGAGPDAAEIRTALPETVRAQFDEAQATVTLTERAHVLLLWRGIAADLADPRGDTAT